MNPKMALAAIAIVGFALCAQPAAAIVNGSLDTNYECVGSLHSSAVGFRCTGTLIDESWVLTSAACAGAAPNLFAMGADWTNSPRVYPVDYAAVHPSYNGDQFDFALLHLASPAVGEPLCSLATTPDGIYVGMPLVTVGYGLTAYPSGTTASRHRGANTLSDLNALQFFYLNSTSLPCHGDHGGPNLDGSSVVVGVVSSMDEECSQFATSNRVAPVYDWIVATVFGWSGIFLDGFETGDTALWNATNP